MQALLAQYVKALKDHRVEYWNDIREAIQRMLLDRRYQ